MMLLGPRHHKDEERTKRVPCMGPNCALRRVHHERPDTPRGQQYLWVPEDHEAPVFCTIECLMYYRGARDQLKGTTKDRLVELMLELERLETAARAEVTLRDEKVERLVDAIDELHRDDIISAGKVREMTGMRCEEQRQRWRDYHAQQQEDQD